MAYLNEKTGYLELSPEDKDALQGRDRDRNWGQNIINKIIWGENKMFYEAPNKEN